MGKIREQRRREKKRKRLIRFGIGFGSALTVLVILVFLIQTIDFPRIDIDTFLSKEDPTDSQMGEEVSKEEGESMQIVMVGDMLMHERIIESGKQEDGSYNFDHLFMNVRDFISEADLAIVNQETIMGGPSFGYTGYPSFNTPFALADSEVNAGFDVLLLATNHAFDKGEKGIRNCMDYLDATYPELGYVGVNRSQEDQDNNIYTYEANGITVAILNYTYGHNGVSLPSDATYLVNMLDEDKVRYDIRKAEEIADFTIVCPHWGTEFKLEANSSQKAWAAIFLEEGVDLVLGTHPHVIEPIEWLTDEDGHKMLVYYSIGNFVNGTDATGDSVTQRMVGGIADITIERNKETGEVEIVKNGAIPIVCHIGTGTEYTVYYLEDYTEELASKNLILSQTSEFSKSLCESIFTQVWGE